jgi:hypothetical protein
MSEMGMLRQLFANTVRRGQVTGSCEGEGRRYSLLSYR